ncbi:topoisomerase DNA-binding C4 zinc finger domain-containing protein [Rheinheimera sp.]|uniref:DNA topoisomerase family protein n=1 Tax=Rheinheimera sp. TaxID=1869214 RepID=UPI00307F12C0
MSTETLFSHEKAAEPCPLCSSPLQIKSGKNGPFLGCSAYPVCNYLKALHPHENTVVKVLDNELCPECQHPLAVKNGRYGMFIGCSNYPSCHFVVHQQEESQTSGIACPSCKKGELVERISKYGKSFYGCNRYPECKFLVNLKPVEGQCGHCGFPLLLEKPSASGIKLICADKKCQQLQSSQ